MSESARKDGMTHLFFWTLTGMVAAFLAWAYVGKLDIVANALGEVIPSTRVKSVQHLEGGIVREILVREGQQVAEGQPLVALDPVRSNADAEELEIRYRDLSVEIARLDAESREASTPDYPAEIAQSNPDLVKRSKTLFETRRAWISSKLESLQERIEQRNNEIAAIQGRIESNRKRLKLVREQIAISEDLMKDQLSNRMQHLNLLKEAAALEARINEDSLAYPRAQAAVNESKAETRSAREEHLRAIREELAEKRGAAQELAARLRKIRDLQERTVLRSPVNGVVKTLHVTTVGGVIAAGSTVADVVPGGDRLVIEAKLPTQDIGYVNVGQKAQVSLASADAARFGRIEGEVVGISPDTIDTKDGIPYYKVRLETAENHFQRGAVRYELVPGVRVMCSIRTGQRSVLAYLLDPFLTSVQTALRER